MNATSSPVAVSPAATGAAEPSSLAPVSADAAEVGSAPTSAAQALTARADWLAWRRGGVGGSDIGALLGLSRYASPWSLWADKVGLLPPDPTSERQQIGHDFEPVLGQIFARRTGLHVVGEQTTCKHRDLDWARCTVDGFVERPEWGVIEGTVQYKTDARWSWDGIPPAIRAQCQWEMGVTQSPRCWLVVLHGGFSVDVHELEFDRSDWEFMLARAGTFWRDHVQTGVPPDVDGSDATTDAMASVWGQHAAGGAVDLDEMGESLAARARLKSTIKLLSDEVDQIDNEVRAQLGAAEFGTVGGEVRATWRTQPGRTTTCDACGHSEVGAPSRRLTYRTPKPRSLND